MGSKNNWEAEGDNTIYFWGGIFSNWSRHGFHARLRLTGSLVKFSSSEQYMMATKAVMFEDVESLTAIMETDNPKTQKAYGRLIEGYTDERWNPVARDMSYVGVYEKFHQNTDIKALLLSTGDKLLVEASPFDRKWGIGYDHINAPAHRDDWGMNWLGQMLMRARDDIRNGNDTTFENIDWTRYEQWI